MTKNNHSKGVIKKMAEKFLLEMAEAIKASIPGNNIQVEDLGS